MHLQSLTLRGFKSFASATTLRFEPGITAVVGPNGSGKSNVVDALAWVMGEQGAKSLRGGTMADVIFAGTSGRPPLGRAEVSLTIDNADGALPIDYSEVTLTRTLFRNGGSEYRINGDACRLLDVQELLSDSGIGREMHVIVGQGRLDAVLSGTPEDRRGFVEEAAGILKHRKRKERALRKLEAMQANLDRLQDLTTELRRQLTPLGRQAEVARRAASVQAEVRDARLRLLAADLVQASAQLESEIADEQALRARRAGVETSLAAAQALEAGCEAAVAEHAPRAARAQETWYALSALRERLRGTAGRAAERERGLRRDLAGAGDRQGDGRDPAELDAQAGRIRAEEQVLAGAVQTAGTARAAASAAVQEAEQGLAMEERALATALRARADRREGLARLGGQAAAAASRVEGAEAEVVRLVAAREEAVGRAELARVRFAALETQVAGLDAGEEDLDAVHEQAAAAFAELGELVEALVADERAAERERAGLAARLEALELTRATRDGAVPLLAGGHAGVLGSAAGLVRVRPGFEAALAAALGAGADAVVVSGLPAAVAAVEALRAQDSGRAALLVSDPAGLGAALRGADDDGPDDDGPDDGSGVPALDLVSAPAGLAPALGAVLADVVVVPDLAAAQAALVLRPELTAVTRAGDVVRSGLVEGGSAAAPSQLEVQAAYSETGRALRAASHRQERSRFALAAARTERADAEERMEAAMARLHESDARMAAVAEELGQLGSAARAAGAEAERLAAGLAAAHDRVWSARAVAAELDQRLAAAGESPDEGEPSRAGRDRWAGLGVERRRAEVEARLAVRTAEERLRALAGRADSLERAAREERASRARAEEREARVQHELAVALEVGAAAAQVLARLERSLSDATAERAAADSAAAADVTALAAARASTRVLDSELAALVDSVHRDELARAEQRMRVDALRARALDELAIDPDVLVADYAPQEHDVRAEQEKRLRAAERALAQLGRVNPLALEEFAALEERHAFLVTQLADLRASRRDLLDIVREVDERVQTVFAEAFADTAREFEGVFARLFPGGEGRLVLTDPDDLLTTGVEVEARPPGKKVKRLSLLSGGERSLTAVAMLVAIFKARPSPFYVMDEVEAALDDTNLGRLLTLLEELRGSSQLILVTHQKRTMEIADALYGVTMRGDGVTAVISQRLREGAPSRSGRPAPLA